MQWLYIFNSKYLPKKVWLVQKVFCGFKLAIINGYTCLWPLGHFNGKNIDYDNWIFKADAKRCKGRFKGALKELRCPTVIYFANKIIPLLIWNLLHCFNVRMPSKVANFCWFHFCPKQHWSTKKQKKIAQAQQVSKQYFIYPFVAYILIYLVVELRKLLERKYCSPIN